MSTDLHPDFPVVTGDYLLTKGWRVTLPAEFNRRIEDDSLVLWKPELTFWINVWNNDVKASVDQQLETILAQVHPDRRAQKVERSDTLARLTYELAEDDAEEPGATHDSINGYIFARSGYVQISAYCDSPQAQALARTIVGSVRPDS